MNETNDNKIIFKQVPLPNVEQFHHNHQCSECNEWSRNLLITYSDSIEETKFICRKCQPIKLIPAPLPTKTEFRKTHECMQCHKKSKTGILTYCSRCEMGEFVCPLCVQNWFDNITQHYEWTDGFDEMVDEYEYDDSEIELEKIVIACIHVIDGSAKRNTIDKMFDNPKTAICDDCQDGFDNIETSDFDPSKNLREIESVELKK